MGDVISVDVFKKRLVDLCVRSRLETFPRKYQDRHILLKSIVLSLDPEAGYTEQEINATVMIWKANVAQALRVDHFSIRRELVDRGYLERDKRGECYRVCRSGTGLTMFAPEVGDLDALVVVEDGKAEIEARKQMYLKQQAQVS